MFVTRYWLPHDVVVQKIFGSIGEIQFSVCSNKRRARRSVSRVLSRPKTGMAIHLGRSSPSASRDRPERRRGRPAQRREPRLMPPAAPTWSCSRWGFPCRRRCRRRGALLPHHFTLAARRPHERDRMGSAVCFCGTFPGVAPAGGYPAPCLRGARTFLPPLSRETEWRAAIRPSGWDHLGCRAPPVKSRRAASR